jgi:uracil-DNA glycosylase
MTETNKPIMLIGEAWGENEARIKAGFCGASGLELLRMLDEAGIISLTPTDREYISSFWNGGDPRMLDMVWRLHPEVYRTNVLNFHPPGNDIISVCGPKKDGIVGFPALIRSKSKFLPQKYIPELERLGDEISAIDPNLIVCLGNTPLWALAGSTGISKLRGTTRLSTHTATGYKLLPTYHSSAVLKQWELRPTTVMDLAKARREAEYPEIRRQRREIWIEPTLEDLDEFFTRFVYSNLSQIVAVDIETSGNQITCIGFAAGPRVAIVIPFVDERRKNRSYWADKNSECKAWEIVRKVLGDRRVKKVFQNGLYDLAFIWRSVGIATLGAEEDSMLLHHALQPEALKGLAYLGSVYADEGAWKSERKGVETTIKRDA